MTAIATPGHRVVVATAHIHDELDTVADAPTWSMGPAETGRTLLELDRAAARIEELRARVAAHADRVGVGSDMAASSTAAWLAHRTKQTGAAATSVVRLGHDLDQHPLVRDALAAGTMVADQARTIIRALGELPDDLDPDVLAKAERFLVEAAGEHDAKALRFLGRRLLEYIAPEIAAAHEATALEAEEKAAARTCWLTLHDDSDGTTRGQFAIPTAIAGATLKKVLHALAAPRHVHATRATKGAGTITHGRPTPERLGDAFSELITRYPTKRLPKTGALNATLVVTIDEDSLLGRLDKAGILDTGQRISPALARKLACQAGILPMVLNGDSQPLDLGRKRRLHTEAQRLAMLARDKGCAAEGCDRTTGLHAHHKQAWADGGPTTITDGVLLCSWHHHRAHDHRYNTTYQPSGKVAFHRRT